MGSDMDQLWIPNPGNKSVVLNTIRDRTSLNSLLPPVNSFVSSLAHESKLRILEFTGPYLNVVLANTMIGQYMAYRVTSDMTLI